MFCSQCGKSLNSEDRFCTHCGAVVEIPRQEIPQTEPPQQELPVQKRKRSKLPLILGLCVLALLILGAIVAFPLLFPGKETVYLLTERIVYTADGDVGSRWTFDYDSRGRLTCASRVNPDGEIQSRLQLDYDEHGNICRETCEVILSDNELSAVNDLHYDYSYTDDGLVDECEIYPHEGGSEYTCDFTYDKDGNLIMVEWDYGTGYSQWEYYEYDEDGKLTDEYFVIKTLSFGPSSEQQGLYSMVHRRTYKYNNAGVLTKVTLSSAYAPDDISRKDLDDLRYVDSGEPYKLEYDSNGRLWAINDVTYDYDKNGNLDEDRFIFDEYGNLIGEEHSNGSRAEYTYEAVTLSRADAQKAQRQKGCLPKEFMRIMTPPVLDPVKFYMYPPVLQNTYFYNYMIPHPIW